MNEKILIVDDEKNIYDYNGNLESGFRNDGATKENSDKDKMIKYAVKGKVCYKKDKDIVYYYSPLKYNNKIIAILELQYTIKESNAFYNNIRKMFSTVGCIGIIAGTLYFSNLTKDIYIMKENVDSVRRKEFDSIKSIKRNDELRELNDGIAYMSHAIKNNIDDLRVERDNLGLAVEKLKKADKEQKQFISNVTHEFKTPVTTIRAYADLFEMYGDDKELINKGCSDIKKECLRITEMVDSVLKLSALEKYDFETVKTKTDLKEVLTDVCKSFSARIKKNNLSMKTEFEDISLICDKESLKHIVINLMDNAVKYNKYNGIIKVKCYKKKESIFIEIEDTGIGIDEKSLSRIFEPFYRTEDHRSRQRGGAGLGLSLAKSLVEKQNGNISVHSEIDKGTKFIIEFTD